MANGAGSVPEKLRPGSGLPQKQAVRGAHCFFVRGVRESASPHLDATTAAHYLWERSRPRTTLGPPPIEKPDPGQSFTPTEPLAPIPTNPAPNAGPSLLAHQPHPISTPRLKSGCGSGLDRERPSVLHPFKIRPGSILHANRAPGPIPTNPAPTAGPSLPADQPHPISTPRLQHITCGSGLDRERPSVLHPSKNQTQLYPACQPGFDPIATNPALNADPSLLADQPHPISMRRLKHITCGRALDRKQRSALRKRNSA